MAIRPMMHVAALWGLATMTALSPISKPVATAAEPAEIAQSMPARVLSVVSEGYWAASDPAARGYYRLIALRSADNTSRLYLQRVRLADDGPEVIASVEIESLTDMRAYITDMRPEKSTGIAERPGSAAFVYLKLNPAAGETDTTNYSSAISRLRRPPTDQLIRASRYPRHLSPTGAPGGRAPTP